MLGATIVSVRFVLSEQALPYGSHTNPRRALDYALADFILGIGTQQLNATNWLITNVLEAKAIPYEAD